MISTVIAYDDNDFDLGDYFEQGFNNINDVIAPLDYITIKTIQGLDCTEANTNDVISQINHSPFVFIGLSHGDVAALMTDNAFVSQDNVHLFPKSFFYTVACCAGVELGPMLIERECQCFVGYTDYSWASYEDFYQIYLDCENHAIKVFLNSDKTVDIAYQEMMNLFDSHIDDQTDLGEIAFAMELQKNKDCMVCLGNSTLTRHDFMISPN